jgi:hypothetical protein
MNELGLVAVALCILAAAGISRRIRGTILTLPMVYVGLGLLLSGRMLGVIELGLESEIVRIIAELTLVLVLASDASRIDLCRLQISGMLCLPGHGSKDIRCSTARQ